MSILGNLQNIIDDARLEYQNIQAGILSPLLQSGKPENLLVKGDNLQLMKYMLEADGEGQINLIYVDPPFFSKVNYDAGIKIRSDIVKDIPQIKIYAYQDTWEKGMEEYLRKLCVGFFMMRDLLADDGSLWVHLDWHGVHYVKILLDEIFGQKNFVNEVIWAYKSGGTSTRHFSRKHDTLLFYSKTKKYYFNPQEEKSYNRNFKPYRFKGVKEYKDDIGWYTTVNMKDVWQIDMVGRTASERTGYATQKPEALLRRIVESCSKQGDVCADFFGGSGTLASVCHKTGRNWISCDLGNLAFSSATKRLMTEGADFVALEQQGYELTQGKVKFDFSVNSLELSDKNMLKLKIVSYTPDVKALKLDKSAESIVRKVIKEDSLCLIDYWSVDFNYDGKAHKPESIFLSGDDKNYECEKIGTSFDNVSVHIVDVFGNSTLERLYSRSRD